MSAAAVNRRILVVDANESVYKSLQQTLNAAFPNSADPAPSLRTTAEIPAFAIDFARDGPTGLELVTQARRQGQSYCIAFVEIQHAPDAGGIQTATRLLAADPMIQVVLCTAGAGCSLSQILAAVGTTDRVMMLKKPFDALQVSLLAVALSSKWQQMCEANARLDQQAGQIHDARRVMSIIEGCLDELETGHDELRHHAVELTNRLQQRTVEVLGTRDLAMFALAQLADSRDPETGEHLLRMRAYAQLLAERLSHDSPYADQIDRAFLEDFYRSTPLHDIGKVGIPDQILLKPGRLSDDEFEIMKQHTVIGAEALQRAARQNCYGTFLDMAAEIARSHHERLDGRGYPDGLAGDSIPLSARITTLADVFDALTSARVYKDAMPPEQARRIIEEQESRQFDPVVVAAFHACYDEFIHVKETIDSESQDVPDPLVSFDHPLPLFRQPEPAV